MNQLIYKKLLHDIEEGYAMFLDHVLATGSDFFNFHIRF